VAREQRVNDSSFRLKPVATGELWGQAVNLGFARWPRWPTDDRDSVDTGRSAASIAETRAREMIRRQAQMLFPL